MLKSGRVRYSDLRRAYRLIHDCRDVGHDPAAWPVVLVEGVARVVDGQITVLGEMASNGTASTSRPRLLASRGWPTDAERAFWFKSHVEEGAFRNATTFLRFLGVPGRLVTRAREQLASDDEWYSSVEFNEYRRPIRTDDFIASYTRSGSPPMLRGFQVSRALGDRAFGPRERRLVRIFHAETARLIGTSLVVDPHDPFAQLPPRLRRTLECLLGGDSEKQAAVRLGVSRHTVHEYVIALYRRLGVSTRAQLLSLCLRSPFGPAGRRPPSPDPPHTP